MVIVKTCGGLGNQLFQYAAALEIAKKYNHTVVFDLEFQKKDKRRFELKNLGIKEKLISAEKKKSIIYKLQNCLMNFYRNHIAYSYWDNNVIRYLFGMFGVFFCNHNNPDLPISLFKNHMILLAGSFSNEKYFLSVIDDLKRQIKLSNKKSAFVRGTHTVCVHIRKGDYVGNAVHEVCTDNYYYRAMDEMEKRLCECNFIVFSDDIEYIKKMCFSHSYVICEEKNTCKSFHYMMQCDHYIISNSTFSWWAQRLSDNNEKIVIAPERWFNTGDICNLYDTDWIKIK